MPCTVFYKGLLDQTARAGLLLRLLAAALFFVAISFPSPSAAAREIADELCRREPEWLDRLAIEPATFAAVEREVHEQARRHADRFVAGLLATVSERQTTAGHVEATLKAAEAPLGAVEKKDGR